MANLTNVEANTFVLTTNDVLRIQIDENWSASEFASLFENVNTIYRFLYITDSIEELILREPILTRLIYGQLLTRMLKTRDQNSILGYIRAFQGEDFEEEAGYLGQSIINWEANYGEMQLGVERISYASPGDIDLVGIGKSLKETADLIKYYLPNKEQRIKNRAAQFELEERKKTAVHEERMRQLEYELKAIEVLERKVGLLAKLGASIEDQEKIKDEVERAIAGVKQLLETSKVKELNVVDDQQ